MDNENTSKKKITNEELLESFISPFRQHFEMKCGMPVDIYLAEKAYEGCEAKKVSRLKIKKATGGLFSKDKPLDVTELPEHCKKVVETEEEAVLEFYDNDGSRQDSNRMDVQKLMDLYPKSKHIVEHQGFSSLISEIMDEIDGNDKGVLPCDQTSAEDE